MRLLLLLLLTFVEFTTAGLSRIFRPSPKNDLPPPKLDTKKPPGTPPNSFQQQQVVAINIARFEKKIDGVEQGVGLATELLKAILDTKAAPTKTSTKKPAATLNMKQFEPCLDYANLLSSCAEKTSSFFALGATSQASCVCYSTSTNAQACVATPTNAYDAYEEACWKFFGDNGYKNTAEAMNTSTALPGPGLCEVLKSEGGLQATLPLSSAQTCTLPTQSSGSSSRSTRVPDTTSYGGFLASFVVIMGLLLGVLI